jgi:hypothetical protein
MVASNAHIGYEHQQVGLFTVGEVPELVMPDGYERSIAAWFACLNGGPTTNRRRGRR